ncbi:MAG: hypothetical protein H6708_33680, partial [Kofleriaceae bacterium]|nr:hypothetical protein [Kofleriaceae bacterium]
GRRAEGGGAADGAEQLAAPDPLLMSIAHGLSSGMPPTHGELKKRAAPARPGAAAGVVLARVGLDPP